MLFSTDIMTTIEYKYILVETVNSDTMIGLNTQCGVMWNEFAPIIIYRAYGKIYKCPCCGSESGTQAPLYPTITEYFSHTRFPYCINNDKIPVEHINQSTTQ